MRLWRKKPKLGREASLKAVPMRNPGVSFSKDEQGLVRITIPRRDVWWVKLLARLFYLPVRKSFSLDELGSFVWEKCDGRTPLKQVVKSLAEKYQLGRKEAELSTASYMKILMKKGLLGMKVK